MDEQLRKISLLISRCFAFIIDLILLSILLIIYFNYIELNFKEDFFKIAYTIILIFQFYFFLFETLFSTTPGKFIFGLRIKFKNEASQVRIIRLLKRIFTLFVRNFVRVLLFVPPLFILNEIIILIFYKGISFGEVITDIRVDFRSD